MATATAMILCDTIILIEFYKNNPQIIQSLQKIGSSAIAISTITQAELYFGALNKAELRAIKRHLSLIHTYPLDTMISSQFIGLMEAYSLSHKLSIPDAIIAATALVYSLELYTLNLKDFRFIPGLTLYTP
jgi:tRNA(fMet)-specific endonuclease VapC